MIIAAIDPSYTNTGLAVVEFREDGKSRVLRHDSLHALSKDVYTFGKVFELADELAERIIEFAQPDYWIIEVPALQTRSGAYLGMIQQALFHRWNAPVYAVPPNAINSFTQNKAGTKSHIVKWVKGKYPKSIGNQRIDNDRCSAIVLARILYAHFQGEYKNTIVCIRK